MGNYITMRSNSISRFSYLILFYIRQKYVIE